MPFVLFLVALGIVGKESRTAAAQEEVEQPENEVSAL